MIINNQKGLVKDLFYSFYDKRIHHVKDEVDRCSVSVVVNSDTNALLNQHIVDGITTCHNYRFYIDYRRNRQKLLIGIQQFLSLKYL